MRKLTLIMLIMGSALPLLCQPDLSWTIVADMNVPRYFFEVQRLDDHRALIMGGAGSRIIASCQIYDSRNKQVTDVASMARSRYAFASARLSDGRVLVCGGSDDYANGMSEIEIFDPKTNSWSAAGTMNFSRWQHSVLVLDDDNVLMVGGWEGPVEAEVYSISKRRSTTIAAFPYISSFGKVFKDPDGRIFHFSGRSRGPGSYRTEEVHELLSNPWRWVKSGSMASVLYYPTLTTTQRGGAVLTGGSIRENDNWDEFATLVQRYNNGSFESIGNLASPRAGHQAVEYSDGVVLVMGGMDNEKRSYHSCEWVDVNTGQVKNGPPMHEIRRFFCALQLLDATNQPVLVAIGGQQTNGVTSTIEELGGCYSSTLSVPLSPPTVSYIASAVEDRGIARLTGTEQYVTGGVWMRQRVPIANGFDIRFTFRFREGSDNGQVDNGPQGADGIAMVFQNESRKSIGTAGDGIGYNTMPHGLAIEFDSYLNPAFSDPSANHIAVQIGDGTILRPWHQAPYLLKVEYENVPQFVADGRIYHARVVYSGGRLSVYCSTPAPTTTPSLVIESIDINKLLNLRADGSSYLGFTSSTGKSSEIHELLSVEIEGCNALVSSAEEDDVVSEPGFTSMSISPNPVRNEAVVRFNGELYRDVTLQLVDARGRVVRVVTVQRGSSSFLMAELDALPAGVYRVVCSDMQHGVSTPLVIVH